MAEGIKQSVLDVFKAFTVKLEGEIAWPYLDKDGQVTVAWGCLIDPFTLAIDLPWVLKGTNNPATKDQAWQSWRRVKLERSLAHRGAKAARQYSDVELSPEGMTNLAMDRLYRNVRHFTDKSFPNFAELPADAQLATISIAWAAGAGTFANMPKYSSALREGRFKDAAEECFLKATSNPGLVPRNWANRKLLSAAATTETPDLITGWP